MAIDIDFFLLDRVFQPVSNLVATWTTCFGLARGAMVLAVESQALTLYWGGLLDTSPANLVASGLIAALTLFGAQQAWRLIGRAERRSRNGTLNVHRITLRGQRLAWLGVGVCCTATLMPQGNIRTGFAVISCLAWIALIYFASCTPLPPAMRRAVALAGAAG